MKKIVYVPCFMLFIATGLNAQSHTDASGGDITGSGGSASYSVGQIDYTTINGAGGMVTEGVQQPFEIFQIYAGIDEVSYDGIKAVVFPNPTPGFIELQISDVKNEQLNYELLDENGSLIEQKSISGSVSNINMSSLSGGIYFLKVTSSGNTIKVFKVIKTY